MNSSESHSQTSTESKDARQKNHLGHIESGKSFIRNKTKVLIDEMEKTVDFLLSKAELNFSSDNFLVSDVPE